MASLLHIPLGFHYLPNRITNIARVDKEKDPRQTLIEKLLANTIDLNDLGIIRNEVTPAELSQIIQKIYDLNESYILRISEVGGVLGYLNQMKNESRQRHFFRKINAGFRGRPNNAVILAEGDSWFNYPLLLTDLIDRIIMERNLALYSIAGGGDWLLSMLSKSEYVEELSLIHPDVFLISGGGNDLVGSRRLAAMVDPTGESQEFQRCAFAKSLLELAEKRFRETTGLGKPGPDPIDPQQFECGCRYLNKDFFALLMFFNLQYCYMISKILGLKSKGKFESIKVITQGYDYAIPSRERKFGWKPWLWYVPVVRGLLGHGDWLKTPLLLRGVPDDQGQHRSIVYAMIYLFNEMMINLPTNLGGSKQVYHIDSRNFVGENGWTDELHAKPGKALEVGEVFIKCIQGAPPTYDQVYLVNKFFS